MDATMKIAVAGATGRVGRHVVDVLRARGHAVVPMSRSTGVDVVTGQGLAQALEGVNAVVDAATGPSPEERAATDFFSAAARNLQEAGERAGVERLVAVSIVGIDRFAAGYGAAKQVHEQRTLAGPVPGIVLRATQFHEFVAQLVEWGQRDGVSSVPTMRCQPVAARTAAEALAELAVTSTPPNGIPELAGPREESLVDLARLYVARSGAAVRIEEAVPDADDPIGEVYASGGLLPAPGATLAGPTFREWLEAGGASGGGGI